MIHKTLSLAEPLFILRMIEMLVSANNSGDLRIAVMPNLTDPKTPPETPDDFFGARVFFLGELDEYYTPGGPPIYLVDLKNIGKQLRLNLCDAWLDRALRDRDSRVLPTYATGHLFLDPKEKTEPIKQLLADGPVLILAPTHEPLSDDHPGAWTLFPDSETVRDALLKTEPVRPFYSVAYLDEEDRACILLHDAWVEALGTRAIAAM